MMLVIIVMIIMILMRITIEVVVTVQIDWKQKGIKPMVAGRRFYYDGELPPPIQIIEVHT